MRTEVNGDWDEGETLPVEDSENWVWVYDYNSNDEDGDGIPELTDSLNQPSSSVYYTGDERNLSSYYYSPRLSGHSVQNRKHISTTKLIWNWHAFDYNPSGDTTPSASTRYYDGSG